jgi:hypothetical protein
VSGDLLLMVIVVPIAAVIAVGFTWLVYIWPSERAQRRRTAAWEAWKARHAQIDALTPTDRKWLDSNLKLADRHWSALTEDVKL